MKLNCSLETRQKKDGTGSYECVVIKITDKIEKLVFLTDAEKELLKMNSSELPDLHF